ncbi:MAG: polyprenol monophosphomannose synthase [Nitrospirae bacterium]|nr:polyprenol monophosphomannose synthase [Nitrospirota bacterium]MBI3593547.1 polyprenol monophosphomannose synthase [Nitrospirota bacterium]
MSGPDIIPLMVMIPTYNESKNIVPLIARIHEVSPESHIVVVDDDSPDGTWKLVENLKAKDPRIHLLHRIGRKGRGSAGAEGFIYAMRQKAETILEMDSDFSHNPSFIPQFLKEIQEFDLVIGSRGVQGGGETGRGLTRPLITKAANFYIRLLLGIPVKDCTAGYRLFRRKVLEDIEVETLVSNGPSIVQEILYRAHLRNFSIKEIPILFEERVAGQSTFNFKIILSSFLMILKFRYLYRNYPPPLYDR